MCRTGHRVTADPYTCSMDRDTAAPRDPAHIRQLLDIATKARGVGLRGGANVFVRDLVECDVGVVAAEVEWALLMQLTRLWEVGWQPLEVHREMRRSGGTTAARLGVVAIDASHASFAPEELDARWRSQLVDLGATGSTPQTGWLEGLGRARVSWTALLDDAVCLNGVLGRLPAIEVLVPPPGAPAGTSSFASAPADEPVLGKIRALLAQAESTPYEAEAETFTAKAHRLMAQHAIDAARLAAASGTPDERPRTVRIPVDDPYAGVKSWLLQVVAESARCRAVWSAGIGLSTVAGFASDVAAVELLFTSLLVQAQAAMTDAARTAPPGARTRSRGYRSSFLQAYVARIADRLAEINAAVMAGEEAEHGSALVPVLEERARAVDEVIDALFPKVGDLRLRGGQDPLGWAGGRQAADLAKLNAAELHDRARRS